MNHCLTIDDGCDYPDSCECTCFDCVRSDREAGDIDEGESEVW